MKKISNVFLILITCTLLFSCNDNEVIDGVLLNKQTVTDLDRNSETNEDVDFLQSQSDFNEAALTAIDEINAFLDNAQGSIDVSNLNVENGVLSFSDSKDFTNLFEEIGTKDEEFQVYLDEKYDELLAVAIGNSQILDFYENDEEEIVNGIEDFMWYYNIHDYNFKKYVSDNLPINTLWQKVKTLTDDWLEESGEELDLETDPSDSFVGNEYLQLLLGENSSIIVAGETEVYEESVEYRTNQAQTRFTNCVNKSSKRVAQRGKRKITVTVFVRDHFGKIQEAGASIIGYKKKRRRWKRRRFGKKLNSFGWIVYNNVFTCEMEIHRSGSRSSRRRRFRAMALTAYNAPGNFSLRVIPEMNRFGANGNGGGVHIGNFYL